MASVGDQLDFNLSSIFDKNLKIFLYFGFWKPSRTQWFYTFYTVFCFVLLILFLLPQGIYMVVNRNDLTEVTGTMFVFCTFFINFIKTIAIYRNISFIREIVDNFKRNPLLQVKMPEHLTLARQTQKLGDHLFVFGSFLGLCTQIFWTTKFLLQNEKSLLTNGWYPYDCQISPNFELTNLFQNICTGFNIIHTMNIDSFSINLMMEVGMQCDYLKLTLEKLTRFRTQGELLQWNESELRPGRDNFIIEMKKNLKYCIRHYIEIKRITKGVENIYRTSMMVLFLGGAFTFCAIFYQLLLIKLVDMEFFYLMFFLFSMLTEQFIFCWFGNEMTYKSQSIYHAIYCIPYWTDCDLELRKMLTIFMISSKKPIVIYAGRIIPLSMNVFLNVLRTSYSYFALLNSL